MFKLSDERILTVCTEAYREYIKAPIDCVTHQTVTNRAIANTATAHTAWEIVDWLKLKEDDRRRLRLDTHARYIAKFRQELQKALLAEGIERIID